MKIKEYIADKIINFVIKNGSLESLEERLDYLVDKTLNIEEKLNDMDAEPLDIIRLKEDIQALENKMNQKYGNFNRELAKLKPPPPQVTISEGLAVTILPPEKKEIIPSKEYFRAKRKNSRK